MLRRSLKALPYMLCAMGLLIGLVAPVGAQTGQLDQNKRADLIIGSGSDTTYSVMLELDQAYNQTPGCFSEAVAGQPAVLNHTCARADISTTLTTENYDHDVAVSMYPVGSSNGISQLCQRGLTNVSLIDYARSSRTPRTTDCQGLRFVAFARDALSWAVSPTGPAANVTSLTQQQLRGIYLDCTINNWSQVGGANAPIIVYTAQAGSGTRATWDSFLSSTANSENCIPADQRSSRVVFENNCALVKEADRANAIIPYSFGRFQVTGGQGCRLGGVDGVQPTKETIADGSFPYNRLLYNVYRNAVTAGRNAPNPTRDYVGESSGWICKPNTSHSVNPSTNKNFGDEITDILGAAGLVPLPVGPIGGGVAGESKCRVTTSP